MPKKEILKTKADGIKKDRMGSLKRLEDKTFSDFIKECMDDYNETHSIEIGTRDLANKASVPYEYCRKIINGQKTTNNRDYIIAIGVALEMSSGQLDEALNKYNYMPGLDENNQREKCIIDNINNRKNPIKITDLNQILIDSGFPGISSLREKNSSKNISNTSYLECLEFKTFSPIESIDNYKDFDYNSLESQYSPTLYKTGAYMILKDKKTKNLIRLYLPSNNYSYYVDIYSTKTKKKSNKRYSDIEKTGRFQRFFVVMQNEVKRELQRLNKTLNDTKNYKHRESARIIDERVCVFYEEFNYSVPELNEYYLVTYSSGKYKYYVYNTSAFMKYYLPEKKYLKYYGKIDLEPTEFYSSIKEMDEIIKNDTNTWQEKSLFKMRKKAFQRIKEHLDSFCKDIKNKRVYIRDYYTIFDSDVHQLLKYYKLEKKFHYRIIEQDEFHEKADCDKKADFELDNGKTVSITLEDLITAFEYGIDDVKDICKYKYELGTLDSLLS